MLPHARTRVLFVAVLSWLSSAQASATDVCRAAVANLMAEHATDHALIESQVRPTWAPSNFTDPAHHDKNNFLYIVRVGKSDELSDVSFVSASVISQDFTGVYAGFTGTAEGQWAYILNVPQENVVISCPKDTGALSTTSSRRGISERTINNSIVPYFGLHTPRYLIAQTKEWQSDYNEIFVRPEHHAHGRTTKVSIAGVVYFPGKNPSAQVREAAERESQQRHIPLVEIQQSSSQ